MQKFKPADGSNPDGTAKDKTEFDPGTTYKSKVINDNQWNVFNVVTGAGYDLIDNDLSQLVKAIRGKYQPNFTYNTSSITAQSVNDIVLGSNGVYYEAKVNAIIGVDPVTDTTGKWREYIPSHKIFSVSTIANMQNIKSPINGTSVIVKDPLRGGLFIYDSTLIAGDNQIINFNGWIRQYRGYIKAEWSGVVYNGSDESSLLHLCQALGTTEITDDINIGSTYVVDGVKIPVITFNGAQNTGVATTPVLDYSTSQVLGNINFDPTYWVGTSTKKHILVGGVIRRDTSTTDGSVVDANNWYFINDTTHIPLNIDFTKGDNALTTQGGCELVTAGADLKIHYKGIALNTLTITPDETFAKKGLKCGNSTAYDNAVLSFIAPCRFTCDLSTLTIIDLDEDIWGAILGNPRFGVSIGTTGFITVSHPNMLDNPTNVARIEYKPTTSNGAHFDVIYESSAGGISNCFLIGQHEGIVTYTGGTWVLSSCEVHDAADYAFAWDAVNGILTVTHPQLSSLTAPTCQITANLVLDTYDIYQYAVTALTTTQFKVKIRDETGVIPALDDQISFAFNRGRTAKVDDSKIDGKLYVDIGDAQCLAKDIDSASGNFWISGIMEI